jgi:hypothetical protein
MTESELKGKVTIISMEKRQITLKDTDGILHPFTWTEPLDVVMRKWKEGYYLAVKYDGSILKNASYWQEGKDAFPKTQGTGYKGQSRNDKAIILQTCMKEAADIRVTAWASPPGSRAEYQTIMEEITTEAIKASRELCKEAGVQ